MLPVGTAALLLEVSDTGQARATYAAVRDLVARGMLPAPRDVVPAARTVLVDGLHDPAAWYAALERALAEGPAPSDAALSSDAADEPVVLDVRYDGPDLPVVAEAWGCTPEEVVRRHTAVVFTVAFCGFAPGFAYCTSDPPLPSVSRRDDPRPSVPAGSVALAAEYCGVYPRTMPGGWQLVGRTDAVLFEAGREQPALLQPGSRVRFESRR